MQASITGISCSEPVRLLKETGTGFYWRPASSGYTVVSFVPKLCASA